MTSESEDPHGKTAKFVGLAVSVLALATTLGGAFVSIVRFYDTSQADIRAAREALQADRAQIAAMTARIDELARLVKDQQDTLVVLWDAYVQGPVAPTAAPRDQTPRWLENSNKDLRKRVQDLERRLLERARGN